MAVLIGTKLFLMELLLYPSVFSASNEDFIYHTDDMFETADYLILLNNKIFTHLKKLNRKVIPCLQSFSKYLEYLADKIEVGSVKEVKIIKTFGREAVEGPAFLFSDTDLETLVEEHCWDYAVAQQLRDVLNEANAVWSRLTAVLAEHIQERANAEANRKDCNITEECDVCDVPC